MEEIKSIIISSIIGCAVIIAMISFYSDTITNYGITPSDDLSDLYNKSCSMSGCEGASASFSDTQISDMSNALLNSSSKETTSSQNVISNAKKAFDFIFNFPTMIHKLMLTTSNILEIPPWVTTLLMVLISITILFVAISIYFRVST